MQYDEFKTKLAETLELKSSPGDDTAFADLPDWDSLKVLEIIMLADMEFQRKLTVALIKEHNTARALYVFLMS